MKELEEVEEVQKVEGHMVTVDGSEGGGQILRTAVALSAIGGRAVRVVNIRKARPKPGLQPQHLLGVRAIAELCAAQVKGAELNSTEIEFIPGPLSPREESSLDVGTAGSVTLLLQALLPCLAAAGGKRRLILRGGTNVPFSPPVDYMREVLCPALGEMGVSIEVEVARRGFYPKGGGEVRVSVQAQDAPRALRRMERGGLKGIRGVVYSCRLPEHVPQRIAKAAASRLERAGYAATIEYDVNAPSGSPGCGVVLVAEFERAALGADALGEVRKPAEKVGEEAAERLLEEIQSGAAVDSHLGDQLVVWAALARGESQYAASRATDHLRSAVAVTAEMLDTRFALSGEAPVVVTCSGRLRR